MNSIPFHIPPTPPSVAFVSESINTHSLLPFRRYSDVKSGRRHLSSGIKALKSGKLANLSLSGLSLVTLKNKLKQNKSNIEWFHLIFWDTEQYHRKRMHVRNERSKLFTYFSGQFQVRELSLVL
ncbi:hypothetical protein H5410_008334 [Solanum commersonii]|uniref:Uncharacterized protein n=1 Tax=Solanum commersonii TaxID=4109 RepID=A0A9J6AFQ4_SOLCO|nr:hypothetical protein H5410_008334 [Solanum commersonii]